MKRLPENPPQIPSLPRKRRILHTSGIILAGLLVPGILLFLLAIFAATPSGTQRIGRELSRILGQPVTIGALRIHGASLGLQGLIIGNAPPFTGNLLTVKSITMVPTLKLVTGTPSLALLEVRGATLALKQNQSGVWNVAPLLQRFRNRPGGGETFIDTLRIQGTSLSVNDRLFPVMDVSLQGLATKGARDASWRVSFADVKRHPVTITGAARPGPSPAVTFAVDAPEIALIGPARFLTLPPVLDLDHGTAALHLTASLQGEVLETTGNLTFGGISVRVKERLIPLTGSLDLAGTYRTDRDEARISRGSVTLAGLGALTGTALVKRVKSEREFSADLAVGSLDISALRRLLYPEGMPGLTAAGTVTLSGPHIAGNARQGLTACRATLTLGKGEASWQGRPLVREMASTISMDKQKDGWALTGRVTSGEGDLVELQSLTAVITGRLSPRFRPLQIEVEPLSGLVRSVGLSGSIRYAASASAPLTLNLMTGTTQLKAFSPYLKERGRIEKGIATVTLAVVASRGFEEVHGTLATSLEDLTAVSSAGKTVTGAGVDLTARFQGGRNSSLEATGHLAASGMLDTRLAEADVSFALSPKQFHLEQGLVRLDDALMTFTGLHGQVPPRSVPSEPDIPVRTRIEGLNLAWRNLSLEKLSAAFDGVWRTTPEGGRFVGNGDLSAGRFSWRSWAATDLAARIAGDGAGIGGNLTGTGLGGPLAASFKAETFTSETPVTFKMIGSKLSAAQVMTALGKPLPVAFTSGLLGAEVSGSYIRTTGARLAATTAVSGLTVVRNGTTILTDMGMVAEGEYDAGRLRLQRGSITAGEKVVVNLSGEVNDLPAATRTGTFTVNLPETSLTAAVNAGAGLLPASFQEVRTEGTVSLRGEVVLEDGKASLRGELHVKEGEVSLPSRQFSTVGIEGTVPISLTIPSAGGASPHRDSGFSREAYPRDLALQQHSLGPPTFRIARIRFGSLETGETLFHLKVAGNRSELVRFETSLYGGRLLGRGGLAWDRGPVYDVDLLIHDLSLSRFCSTIPAITGYLSGKVDGVVGLHGERGGLDGALGFFDIWARSAADEELLVSKKFLQKLAGRKLQGFLFREDRAYDRGALSGHLSRGYITLSELDIAHTNLFGVRDLSVTVVPTQNRISLEHLISAIKTAAQRGKPAKEEGDAPADALPQTEFKWLE